MLRLIYFSDRMNSQPSALSSTEPCTASRPNLCTAPLSPTEQHILNHTLFNPLLTDPYNKLQSISGIVLLHCIYSTGYNYALKARGMGITTKWHQICSAGVRPTFCTEPEPNVRLSSMENSSGSRTVLLSLSWIQYQICLGICSIPVLDLRTISQSCAHGIIMEFGAINIKCQIY